MPKETTIEAEATPSIETVLIVVLEKGTEIEGHKKDKGRRERIPLDQAKALEALGKVRITGI